MKHVYYTYLLTILMSMVGARGFAHDIEVANSDGKTIYYTYNTDGTSVSVTYQGTSYSSYSKEYTGDVVIPETVTYGGKTYSVTSIGSYAFYACSGLTSVTIPNSVTSIGYEAFRACSGLTSVTIPNSVTSIGNEAFGACSGLTSVSIPNSVTSIGSSAFSGTAWYNNQPDGLVYVGDFAYEYKGTMPANTSITFKEGTVGIASSAFRDCSGLTSMTIPNSVTYIGSGAFFGCSGLEKVIVPDIENWCNIDFGDYNYNGNPLYYAHHLYSDENTEITKLVIPDGVTSIGSYVFSGCSNLTSVTIPNSVTSIGSGAFFGCSGLEKVIVPNFDIKKWCSIKFESNDSNPLSYAHHLYSDENTEITELVIPDDITSIDYYCFLGWNTYLVIPENITFLDNVSSKLNDLKYAIYKCKTPPAIKDGSKEFKPISKIIFVPEESILEYKLRQEHLDGDVYSWVNADVEFYTKVTADEYAKVMSGKNKSTITSVAMYDGMDENLTEAMMKDGMNPNCLYYIFTDKEMTGDNIIDLKTCTTNKIALQDNNIFKCPASFTATKAQFTYTPSVWANGFGGWETLCLPFEVSAFKASESGYISPILLGAYGDFWLRQFVGASSKALYFSSTLDGTMKANTPYLLAFPGSVMGNGHLQGQTITFLGKNVEVEANATAEVQRNDKVFVGNYDNVADDASGWILNSTGSDLIASSVVGDKPFRAYFRTEDDFADFNAAKTLNISFVEDEETAIREINEDRDAENDLNIFSIDGMLIRKAENTSDSLKGLKKGTYIINHKKVMIR